jgi:SAM-dependent MidA family methyltransferase
LPEPDPLARAHSARVVDAVREAIVDAGGWISLARYMHHVLYAPGLGYYVAGARKFGADGDFITAPEMTPVFAQALAQQVKAVLAVSRARDIVEFGAGSGALAADLLNALAGADALPARYLILDVSPELRQRQRETIGRIASAHRSRVEWLDAPPVTIDGAVLMNEVLDAVPAHVIVRRNGEWLERGVVWHNGMQVADRPLADDSLRTLAGERFPEAIDYTSEVNPAAAALVADIGARMTGGALLVLDYGFPQGEYYHPQRSEGTLMGHYRHRAHGNPLLWPGLSDLTTHVDFTAVATAGVTSGLTLAGYAPMAAFLVSTGILDHLQAQGDPRSIGYMREAAAVQKLLSPAEMGELFKVMALARSPEIDWHAFAAGERSHRL